MPSFCSVVLLGHLARDPELRYTPQGAAVCELTLAVNRKFTRKGGEEVEEVSFIDVTVWNRTAEVSAEYLKKGRAALVSGRLVQDRWEDGETGQKRSKLKVVADSVQFLGGGSRDDASPEETTPATPAPDPVPASPEEPAALPPAPAPTPAPGRKAPGKRRRTA
jgi:single-strand DNA-binding protein